MPRQTSELVTPTAFHLRLAVAGTGGVFADGYGLGIVGIALANASGQWNLTPLVTGLAGGAALAGLFLGALLTGPCADRFGRRPVFASNMLILLVLSLLQACVASAPALVAARFLIGATLGTDYVVSKAMLAEWMPLRIRGRVLAGLAVAWAAGYASAYFVGYALEGSGTDAWRWMLASSALPCLIVWPLRRSIPETPAWLLNHGQADVAAKVVTAVLGQGVAPPSSGRLEERQSWGMLFGPELRMRSFVACTIFVCQVIPYFALGTFVARVLAALHVSSATAAGLTYNVALLSGAIIGLLVVERVPRRAFLIGSFAIAAMAMAILVPDIVWPRWMTIACFVVFAGTVSAASNILYVYLPELFPTSLRASGIGLAVAFSRVGSAMATFLLPVVVVEFGARMALGACVAVLCVGGLVCALYAPETRATVRPNQFGAVSGT
jgi:putative MFS transporter